MAEPVEQRGGLRFDIFSDESRQVLFRAQEEARRLNHNYIGTEHMLLGLVSGDVDDLAVRVLSNLGTDLNKIRSGVEFIIGRGERTPPQDIEVLHQGLKMYLSWHKKNI